MQEPLDWQPDFESRTSANSALNFDAPMMQVHDFLDYRQSKPSAVYFGLPYIFPTIEPLKNVV